jgi:hypothetical protein
MFAAAVLVLVVVVVVVVVIVGGGGGGVKGANVTDTKVLVLITILSSYLLISRICIFFTVLL